MPPDMPPIDQNDTNSAKNWKWPIYFGCCHIIVSIVSLFLFIWVAVLSGHLDFYPNKYPMNVGIATQAAKDWSTVPFTEITVETIACEESGSVPVFERWWLGTKMGYKKKGKIEPTDDESWMEIPALPAVSQSQLNDRWICGKRNG